MSMRSLESAVLGELREVSGRRSLRMKDVMEWSTGKVKVNSDETAFYLPGLKVNCAVKTEALGKKRTADSTVSEHSEIRSES
jgi:hypothetical protein